MSTFIRASKFRHVFAEHPRLDATYQNLRLSTVTGEQNYIKANPLYFAVGTQGGGGPFAVIPLDKPGRVDPAAPVINGHTGAVLDFDFNPFNDNIIASASEDMTVKVWGIPEGGLTANIETPLVDLHGHSRRVTLLRFHPTSDGVLASVSGDNTVKLWDITAGREINGLDPGVHDHQLIQDCVWDYIGQMYATSAKDKIVRIIDARSATVADSIPNAHEGSKSVKLTYLGSSNNLLSVGFTKQSMRQFKIWDPRNTAKPLKSLDVDQAAGVIMPFYDPDTQLLYLAGKGDGNVRFYEIVNSEPYVYPVSDHRSTVAAKGMAWVPKRGLNIMANETARLLKLTTNSVEPLQFFVPRKSESFQEDLYPDTAAKIPAQTCAEWLGGGNKEPVHVSLNPAKAGTSGFFNVFADESLLVCARFSHSLPPSPSLVPSNYHHRCHQDCIACGRRQVLCARQECRRAAGRARRCQRQN